MVGTRDIVYVVKIRVDMHRLLLFHAGDWTHREVAFIWFASLKVLADTFGLWLIDA